LEAKPLLFLYRLKVNPPVEEAEAEVEVVDDEGDEVEEVALQIFLLLTPQRQILQEELLPERPPISQQKPLFLQNIAFLKL
jgi:hypothetical protein